MSPRKRHFSAWLAPLAVLAVVSIAWWVSRAPQRHAKSAKSPESSKLEILQLRKTHTALPVEPTAPHLQPLNPRQRDESPKETLYRRPVRRISPNSVNHRESASSEDQSRPMLRAKQISDSYDSASLAPSRNVRRILLGPQLSKGNPRSPANSDDDSLELTPPSASDLRRVEIEPEAPSYQEQAAAPRSEPHDCWWQPEVPKPLRPGDKKWDVQLDDLLVLSLEHSDFVQSMRIEPLIQETEIAVEAAAFDPAAFVDSKWNDLSDPVGNALLTGNASRRLNDHNLENKAGIRQKNRVGGRFEAAQEIGLRNTNSSFFQPKDQANTRLVLSYTQPLLRGRGRCYNEAFVVLAQIDTDIARRQLQQNLQDHLLDVAEAYWTLYLERARLVQQQHALERTMSLQSELEARAEIDVVRSQILRARGSVAQRRAAVKRAEIGVRNQEAVLWSLTNAPNLVDRKHIEILPANAPDCRPLPVTTPGSVTEAINRRPEVAVVFEKIHAAQTRLGIAENELLPTLNLFMETYVRGLDGDFDVSSSLGRQFDTGAPSYSIGLSFLMPYGNVVSKANLTKRQLEMSQLAFELNATLKRVTVEVENSLRDIDAAQVAIASNRESMEAAEAELDYLLDRWRMLPGEDRLASLLLDEALGALDRAVAAESAFAQSQVEYALAITRYKRAAGMLLQAYPVAPDRPPLNPSRLEPVEPPVGKSARRPSKSLR